MLFRSSGIAAEDCYTLDTISKHQFECLYGLFFVISQRNFPPQLSNRSRTHRVGTKIEALDIDWYFIILIFEG